MILQEFITININPMNRDYFISKGYDVPHCTYRNKNQNTLTIKVCDLPENSHVKVECRCECGLKQLKQYRRANTLCKTCSNKLRTGNKNYSFMHGNHSYSVYKSSAKKRGYVFALTVPEFENITSQHCHYCGNEDKIGIDRKDNKVGYIFKNCLPCCAICNRAKRDLDYDVFLQHTLKIVKNLLPDNVHS